MKYFGCLAVSLLISPNIASGKISLKSTQTIRGNTFSTSYQARNSISGRIFDSSRRPVADIFVELLDEVDSTIARSRTNGSGLYTFNGIAGGRYTVRVLPLGTDYEEQTQSAYIDNFVTNTPVGRIITGAQDLQLDFYLKVKKRVNSEPFASNGVVFAQEVPKEAEKYYEKGIASLRDKNEKEGFENLKKSLEVFPDYYLALNRLGTEYVVHGYYEAAYILLTKATEVNPNSFPSTFGLGLSLYHLAQNNKSVDVLQKATTLNNKSPDAYLWLGVALKRNKKFDQAEIAFNKAKEFSKGKYAQVYWQLALLYNQQHRYKEASEALESFLKLQPDSRDVEKIKKLIEELRQKQ